MTGQMKEESDATASAPSELAQVTPSDRLTGTTACEREASATASLLRHVMQIGPARPAALTEAGGQSKDMQSADRHYPLQANNSSSNSNGWREHASMLSVVVILLTNMRYY